MDQLHCVIILTGSPWIAIFFYVISQSNFRMDKVYEQTWLGGLWTIITFCWVFAWVVLTIRIHIELMKTTVAAWCCSIARFRNETAFTSAKSTQVRVRYIHNFLFYCAIKLINQGESKIGTIGYKVYALRAWKTVAYRIFPKVAKTLANKKWKLWFTK